MKGLLVGSPNSTTCGMVAAVALVLLFGITAQARQNRSWLPAGPNGMALGNDVASGQVNAVVVDPRNANVLYAGASEGGVWKSTNGGESWTPLTDTQLVRSTIWGQQRSTLSIGSLAVDASQPDIIYVGTGDRNPATSVVGPGLGVFRSQDGGTHWQPLGADVAVCDNGFMSVAVVNRMLIRPRGNTTPLLAATNLGLFLYEQSQNDCWHRIAAGFPFGNVSDLVVDGQGTLYAAVWSLGVYRSDTDIHTWTKLAAGLPSAGIGRIALAASRPGHVAAVYAGFETAGGYRLFKSSDHGLNWNELPSPPSEGQLSFNNVLAVGTWNSDSVFVGQVGLWHAFDGGKLGGIIDFSTSGSNWSSSWSWMSCCTGDRNFTRAGISLHADIHDIAFAPPGTFGQDPAVVEIMYVAHDGGVAKGITNDIGVVSWTPVTYGLSVGQCGTVAASPSQPGVVACGLWHNGNALVGGTPWIAFAVGGGDGFQVSIDAGGAPSFVVYHNCNAAYGGAICRAVTMPHSLIVDRDEVVWHDNAAVAHWSDPYRPGHLFRLQNGQVFRTTSAHVDSASVLDAPTAWTMIEPAAKAGNTSMLAFRSSQVDVTPIYYIGTTAGEIWRGSPEAGWVRLCQGAGAVSGIEPDPTFDERVFATFRTQSSPGRIMELTRESGVSWQVQNIDGNFTPDLAVTDVTGVVVDPQSTSSTVIYVGTDQGLYEGHRASSSWTWEPALGFPHVRVMGLKRDQSATLASSQGSVYAATFGRAIFKLQAVPVLTSGISPNLGDAIRRLPPFLAYAPSELHRSGVRIIAMAIGEDGAPRGLDPTLRVRATSRSASRVAAMRAPVSLNLPPGTTVSVEAPAIVRAGADSFRFVGWSQKPTTGGSTLRLTLGGGVDQAIAYYRRGMTLAVLKPTNPLRVTSSVTARNACTTNFTHELSLGWTTSGGVPPFRMLGEVTYPNREPEHLSLQSASGAYVLPVNVPAGGLVRLRVTAIGKDRMSRSSESSLQLAACSSR